MGYTRWVPPVAASGLAIFYLGAALTAPQLLPWVAVAAALGGCALALGRRHHPRLVTSLGLIGAWLGVGFAGAWSLRSEPLLGLAWTLGVLFLLPLPAVPWLYFHTFSQGDTHPPGGTP